MITAGSNSTDRANPPDTDGGIASSASSASSATTSATFAAVGGMENRGRPRESAQRGPEFSPPAEDAVSPSPSSRGTGKGSGSAARGSSGERRRGTRGSGATGEVRHSTTAAVVVVVAHVHGCAYSTTIIPCVRQHDDVVFRFENTRPLKPAVCVATLLLMLYCCCNTPLFDSRL